MLYLFTIFLLYSILYTFLDCYCWSELKKHDEGHGWLTPYVNTDNLDNICINHCIKSRSIQTNENYYKS